MAHRVFSDEHGVEWQVWAVIPTLAQRELRHRNSQTQSSLSRELSQGWLAFQSRDERRRLVPTPAGWETLPEAGLGALLEQAEPVAATRRLIE